MSDSQSAKQLSKNQAHHERMKHIDVLHHFIREILDKKEVCLMKVVGDDNPAGIFTKKVPMEKLKHCLKLLQMEENTEQDE